MIESPVLTRIGAQIGGEWVAPRDAAIEVRNPATGERLARVPSLGTDEVGRAIDAAAHAMAKTVSLEERRAWLEQIVERLTAHRTELARIITLEQGKPLKESEAEVEYAAGFFRFFAENLESLAPRVAAESLKNCRWVVHHRPAGVCGLITPWNFPLAMLAKKLSAAIAAGCGVIAKPAQQTPLAPIALWNLLEDTGIPRGLVNLVIGEPGLITAPLFEHPLVRLVSFTGSTQVGKLLIEQSAGHVKRLALELGGNAPFIVFDDAEMESAAGALMVSKFRCAGQTCVCANRVFVHEAVRERFEELVVRRVAALRVGNGLESGIDLGPLIDRKGFDKVQHHVQDAIGRGARRLHGSDAEPLRENSGCFFPPTVLSGVTAEMQVAREETFGPVVAIATFTSEEGVIEDANSTPYGLAAYVFTRDPQRAQRVAAGLHFGYVGVNTGTGPTPEAPFGGMKESGYGREGGLEGLLEFCEPQTVATSA